MAKTRPNEQTSGSEPEPALPDVLVDPVGVQEAAARVRARMFKKPTQVKIGRYTILGQIGSGATSVVYRALDSDLDREVALKVLLAGTEVRAKGLEEARVLASLQHPNVVEVFDVGVHEGRAFMALEFASGTTMREWLSEPRSWAEIVDVFFDVARGLEAVHSVGLVHRDVKPDNIMLGDDNRTRLVDFGLAASPDPAGASEPLSCAGTPVYMAPEQHAGGRVTAKSDQFAFCVALYEALHGTRPFDERGLAALIVSKASADYPASDTPPRMPRILTRVLRRGLKAKPEDRWPSMASIRHTLGRLRTPPLVGRRYLWALGGALVLVATSLAWGQRVRWRRGEMLGQLAQAAGEATRTVESRRRVREVALTLQGGELELAVAKLAKLRESKLEPHSTVSQAELHLLDARIALAGGDMRGGIAKAEEAFFLVRDRGIEGRPVAFEAAMVAAKSAEQLGQIELGFSWVRHAESIALSTAAGSTDEGRLVGMKAMLSFHGGKGEAALELCLESLRMLEASAGVHSRLAVDTLVYLVAIYSRQGRLEEAADASTLLLERLDKSEFPARKTLAAAYELRGIILFLQGKFLASATASRQALELGEELFDDRHPSIVAPLQNIGGAYLELGRYDDAREALSRALEIGTEAYGKTHTIVSTIELNLGRIGVQQKNPEYALRFIGRACATYESLGAIARRELADCFATESEARLLRSDGGAEAESASRRALELANEVEDEALVARATALLERSTQER